MHPEPAQPALGPDQGAVYITSAQDTKAGIRRPDPEVSVHLVTLPSHRGGTCCSVTVYRRTARHPPVAVVTDSATNPGVSAHLVLDVLTDSVLEQLPPGSEEPVWVLRWVERAVASVLLDDTPVLTHHLLVRNQLGWRRAPLPAAMVEELLHR